MDFVTLLKRDHEKFLSIFHQTQRGFDQPDTPDRHQLFRQLKSELELHAAVEGLHVYRVFQQSEFTHDDAHEAQEAHAKIKTILEQLETAQVYDHNWVSEFHELQKLVETHVAAEENEMFRKSEEFMTPQEAEELGIAITSAKQAISRNAPTTEGGTPERT